jgi:molecular chaperone GrpE
VGEERPKGDEDPETPAADLGSLEELEAEASVPALDAAAARTGDPADLSEALDLPTAEDAAEAYHRRARLAEDRLAEVLAAYRKVKAENDGFRERIKRTLERQYEQRGERLLLKFIDVLDNFDRALEAAQTSYAGEPLVEGLILVRTQLLQTLKDQGLERIPVLGLPYDPQFSEAVGTQPVQDPDHHHLVVKELLRGYRLKGKVARHSRVLIGECAAVTGQAPPAPAALPDDATVEVAATDTLAEAVADAEEAVADVDEDAAVVLVPSESELSLEEIIARAEAQDVEFPSSEGDAPSEDAVPPPPAVEVAVDAEPPGEALTLEEKPFDHDDTRPLSVLPDADADSLAAALEEEGWPEGLELPGLEGPVADPDRRKR